MSTLDARKNFAQVEVSTGYDSSATSIVLANGEGSKLPDPATDGAFNLVWWNATSYADPTNDPYREIVRCTARSTDTLTVTRGQEGTTAQNHNITGKTYAMALTLTAKMIDDIETAIDGKQSALGFTPENTANKKTSLADNSDTYYPTQKAVKTAIDSKQDKLVSGTNIKTINSNTLLGSGNIETPQNLDDLLDIPEHPGVADKILNTKSSGYEWVDRPTDFGIIGEIKLWTSDTLPSAKWLICNGAAISRTTYSALFALIGTTYGAGDGSTTFNIPDLRGNVPVGKSTDTEFNTLGKKGGEKKHQLTIAELAAHTHTINSANSGGQAATSYYAYCTAEPRLTSSTGGDQPHNNLQPYITLNYIIKAL